MYCTSSKRNKTQKHIKASRSGFPDPSCQCGDIKVSSFYSFSVLSVPEHYTPYTSTRFFAKVYRKIKVRICRKSQNISKKQISRQKLQNLPKSRKSVSPERNLSLHMSQMLYAGQSARPSVSFLSDF